jgi:hypothetical protein
MVNCVPELTGYAGVRRIAVSLPYAAQLIDGTKYMEPADVPRLEGTEGQAGAAIRRHRANGQPAARLDDPVAAAVSGLWKTCRRCGRHRSSSN